jgi:hypothetical protein
MVSCPFPALLQLRVNTRAAHSFHEVVIEIMIASSTITD